MTAKAAREKAKLDVDKAAKAARVTPEYLSQCERSGKFSYVLAMRLHRVYRCPLDVFICGKTVPSVQIRP